MHSRRFLHPRQIRRFRCRPALRRCRSKHLSNAIVVAFRKDQISRAVEVESRETGKAGLRRRSAIARVVTFAVAGVGGDGAAACDIADDAIVSVGEVQISIRPEGEIVRAAQRGGGRRTAVTRVTSIPFPANTLIVPFGATRRMRYTPGSAK